MERSDWEWADEALRDNRCSAEFASEAAARSETLRPLTVNESQLRSKKSCRQSGI